MSQMLDHRRPRPLIARANSLLLQVFHPSRDFLLHLCGHEFTVHYCGSHSTSKTLLSFTVNLPSVNRRTASGYNRCSSLSILWLSVSTVSSSRTGTGVCRIIGPASTPLLATWTVHPVTLAPWSSACFWAFSPGKAGSNEGCMLRTRLS